MGTPLVFNIQKYAIHDGEGIRTTVFFKGCPLSCRWCHNPESQRWQRELMFHRDRCTGCGACAAVCPEGAAQSGEGCAGCGSSSQFLQQLREHGKAQGRLQKEGVLLPVLFMWDPCRHSAPGIIQEQGLEQGFCVLGPLRRLGVGEDPLPLSQGAGGQEGRFPAFLLCPLGEALPKGQIGRAHV